MLPTATFVKFTDVGENRIGPTMPSPVKGTDCDEPGASSRIVTRFVLLPDASGRNWIETMQEAAAAKVAGNSGQVVIYSMKSEPDGTEMLEIVSGTDWLLVNVKDFAAEVCPICTVFHERLDGAKATAAIQLNVWREHRTTIAASISGLSILETNEEGSTERINKGLLAEDSI